MKRCLSLLFLLCAAAWSVPAAALESFVVRDIRVEGLQQLTVGAVFAVLPVKLGQSVDQAALQQAAHRVFAMGYFEDVRIAREGEVLVLVVRERPSISEIEISGNKRLPTEGILDALRNNGLAEGQAFKRSTLRAIELALRTEYLGQGYYSMEVETSWKQQSNNRVAIEISISEGRAARIEGINIIGNEAFPDEELQTLFESKEHSRWSLWGSAHRYSQERLQGDIERLNSHYLNRGYADFRVESIQVSLTPERDAVYVSLNLQEGNIYRVTELDLVGDLEPALQRSLRRILPEEIDIPFAQSYIVKVEQLVKQQLGHEGFIFANIASESEFIDDSQVKLRFLVEPGKRTYVRRISFLGNNKTADRVLRQELRQMESAQASTEKIQQSQVRLNRLGFFQGVEVQTQRVAGNEDQVDLFFQVEEQPSSSITASLGYSQDVNLSLGLDLQFNNFLGSGKEVAVGVQRNNYRDYFYTRYRDPYYTEHGISRGFSLVYRTTDLSEVNVTNYHTDSYGASVNFGYPIGETQSLNVAAGYLRTQVAAGSGAAQEVISSPRLFREVPQRYIVTPADADTDAVTAPFIDAQSGRDVVADTYSALGLKPGFLDLYGEVFGNVSMTVGWQQSALNRGLLPDRGFSQAISVELSAPASDLEFYKIIYRGQRFFEINDYMTLRMSTRLGHGGGYGKLDELPFYENFFGGGIGSLRGFRRNTLGPLTSLAYNYVQPLSVRTGETDLTFGAYVVCNADSTTGCAHDDPEDDITVLAANPVVGTDDDNFGGDTLVETSIELLVRPPFIEEANLLRTALFIDAGNVFDDDCRPGQKNCSSVDFGEMRYSIGLGLTWINAIAPLSFSYARVLNKSEYDEEERFQFVLGQVF